MHLKWLISQNLDYKTNNVDIFRVENAAISVESTARWNYFMALTNVFLLCKKNMRLLDNYEALWSHWGDRGFEGKMTQKICFETGEIKECFKQILKAQEEGKTRRGAIK